MPDRETVIKGLIKCRRCECDDCTEKGSSKAPWDCPAYDDFVDSAIDMLKEQEPMQVKTDMYGNAYCPWCSTDRTIEMGAQRLHLGTHFCPYCGKAVKWE